LLTLSRAALLLLKKKKTYQPKKCPGSAFPFAKQRREVVAPGKAPSSARGLGGESDAAGRLLSSSRVTSSECPAWDEVKCTYQK